MHQRSAFLLFELLPWTAQGVVDGLLARWGALAPAQQPAHLGERMEELFVEASMLEAVRCCWNPPLLQVRLVDATPAAWLRHACQLHLPSGVQDLHKGRLAHERRAGPLQM